MIKTNEQGQKERHREKKKSTEKKESKKVRNKAKKKERRKVKKKEKKKEGKRTSESSLKMNGVPELKGIQLEGTIFVTFTFVAFNAMKTGVTRAKTA